MEIDAAYFDFAGVLVYDGFVDLSQYEEDFGIAQNSLQMAKNRHWLDLRIGKITEKEFWEKVFIDAGIMPGDEFIEIVRNGVLKSHSPHKHVFDFAEMLKSSGKRVGIMTNICREWLEYFDDRLKLRELFDPIIPSYEMEYAKPDIRYFYRAIRKYGIDPYKSWYFDDHEENAIAASRAGFKAALFRPY